MRASARLSVASSLVALAALAASGCRTTPTAGDSAVASDMTGTAQPAAAPEVGQPANPNAPTPPLTETVDQELARAIYERIGSQLASEYQAQHPEAAEIKLADFDRFAFRLVRPYDPTIADRVDEGETSETVSIIGAFAARAPKPGTVEVETSCFGLSGVVEIFRALDDVTLILPPESRVQYVNQPISCN